MHSLGSLPPTIWKSRAATRSPLGTLRGRITSHPALGLREYLIPNQKFPMNFEWLYVFFALFRNFLRAVDELRRTPLKRSSRVELTYPIAPALMLQVGGRDIGHSLRGADISLQ